MGDIDNVFGAEEQDYEPVMVEYRAHFERTVTYTERCYVYFVAPEDLDDDVLGDLALDAFGGSDKYWQSNNDDYCDHADLIEVLEP